MNRSTIRCAIALCAVVMALISGAVVGAVPARAAWGEPDGCGPGGWISDVLGATPYNDRFAPACNLHDWCYGGAAKPVNVGAVGDWLSRKRCDVVASIPMRGRIASLNVAAAAAIACFEVVRRREREGRGR